MRHIIAPSLLSANFACLAKELKELKKSGTQWVHFDVMDAHFVPNLSMGPLVLKSLSALGMEFIFDTHLMVKEPEKLLESFINAGASRISVHVEAQVDVPYVKNFLSKHNVPLGLAVKPQTPIEQVFPLAEHIDLVLIMTVEPGRGGQDFLHNQTNKITKLRKYVTEQNLNLVIQVDGGIKPATAPLCKEADVLVAGSFIFSNPTQSPKGVYYEAIQSLSKALSY